MSWCQFVLDDSLNAVVCFQPPSLRTGKVWYLRYTFVCVPYTSKCIGEWAGGKDCEIDLTIGEFSISSALWILEVLLGVFIDTVPI